MVKGMSRQVIVVKPADTELFDQAIFLLKEEALRAKGVTERQILEEARRITDNSVSHKIKRSRGVHRLPPIAWTGIGAACTGLAWLLSL